MAIAFIETFLRVFYRFQSANDAEISKNVAQFENAVQKQINDIGASHSLAQNVNEVRLDLNHSLGSRWNSECNIRVYFEKNAKTMDELKQRSMAENDYRASYRGKVALQIQHEEKLAVCNKENAHIIARKYALEQEKLRANHVASLPKKNPEKEIKAAAPTKGATRMVSLHDANTFMTTRYHMPDAIVDKSNKNDPVSLLESLEISLHLFV